MQMQGGIKLKALVGKVLAKGQNSWMGFYERVLVKTIW